MSTSLQKNLRQHLEKKNTTAHALEKQLGLKFSAIYNILQGKSKKPSADLILSIAQGLGCSVEDLLQNPGESPLPPSKKPKKWIPSLYIDAFKKVEALLEQKKVETSKEVCLNLVEEVYLYSLQGKLSSADEQFANWLIHRLFPSKS